MVADWFPSYSSFLVASKVVVASKSYSADQQWVFESSLDQEGDGQSFKIYEDPRGNSLGSRGTEITLYLRDEAKKYLQESELVDLVKQQAEFTTGEVPIFVWGTETVTEESKEEQDEEGAKDEKPKTTTKQAWKRVNDQPPLWTRDPKAVSEAEYQAFYKATFKDNSDPLVWSHQKVCGSLRLSNRAHFVPRATLDLPPSAP